MPSALDHSYRTKVFNDLFREFHETSFAIRSADDWHWSSSPEDKPQCTLVFKTAAAWRTLMEDPTERTLGEVFINGELDVEGDLFSVFPVVHYIIGHPAGSRFSIMRAIWHSSSDFARLLRYGTRHSMARDRASISYHYDLPIDFYRPWLGPTLAYSCAYFRDPSESLESAQTNKLELICRKLGLRPNDRFLDIGCGWGSLVLHAASQFGAEAYGITLSKEQAAVAGHPDHLRQRLLGLRQMHRKGVRDRDIELVVVERGLRRVALNEVRALSARGEQLLPLVEQGL